MNVFLSLFVGVVAGLFFVPQKFKKHNSRLQMICTLILIFIMGLSLGSRENLFKEILSLGFDSVVFAIVPMVGSILLVFLLTRKLFKK